MGSTTGKIKFQGASEYKNELAKLSAANKALAAEMKELKSSFDSTTTSEQKHEQVAAQLNKQISAQAQYCDKLKEKLAAMQQQHLEGSKEYYQTEEALHKAQAAMNEMENELASLSDAEEKAIPSTVEMAAAFDTIKDITEKAVDAFMQCANAAIDFEAAMAGVSRTTGLQGEALDNMAAAFQDMSITMPVSANEFARIATTAGQLGIAQEDVQVFSETIAKLSVVAQMSSDEVATSMAQIANITGDNDFGKMADTIAVMGDATATTAGRILDMSLNLAASAKNAGMSTENIIALSAAVSSTGVQAQAGGTAISRLIQQINMAVATGDKLEDFAATAGMTAAEFAAAWGHDATGAFENFIIGLDEATQAGENMDVMLSDLGISSVRELTVVKNLATNSQKLSEALGMANTAAAEGTGLNEKYGVMSGTTAAKMEMMSNSAEVMKQKVGAALAPALGDAADMATKLYEAIGNVAEASPEAVRMITGIVTATAGMMIIPPIIEKVKTAFMFFNTNPINLAIAASIGAIAAAAINCKNNFDALVDSMVDENASIDDLNANLETLKAKEQSLEQAMIDTGESAGFYQEELDATRIAIKKTEEQIDAYNESVEEAAQAEAEHQEYLKSMPGILEVMNADLEALCQAYDEAYQSAYESLSGQFDLFEKAPEVVKTSSKDMIAALNSQEEYFNTYAANLEKIKELIASGGLDADILGEVDGGSAADVAEAASIVEGYTEALKSGDGAAQDFVNNLNAAFEGQKAAMEAAAGAMAEAQTDFEEKWTAIVGAAEAGAADCDQSDAAYTSGVNTIQGLLNGYDSMMDSIRAKGEEAGKAFMAGYDSEADIGSPSKEMAKRGVWMIQGLINGVNSMTQQAVGAMAGMGSRMMAGIAGGMTTNNYNGDITIPVYGAQGQNINELADVVMEKINTAVSQREALWR